MSDVRENAIKVSDALFEHCEELALGVMRYDTDGLVVDHPVYKMMNHFIDSVPDLESRQILKCDWDDFGITRSQHANPRPAVLAGIDLARWVRNVFDPDELLAEIGDARVNSSWSIDRSPSDWVQVLNYLNVEMSLSKFDRLRKSGRYRQRPGSNSQNVSLRIIDLPPAYRDEIRLSEIRRNSQ